MWLGEWPKGPLSCMVLCACLPRSHAQPYWTWGGGRTGRHWEVCAGCCGLCVSTTPISVCVLYVTLGGPMGTMTGRSVGRQRKAAARPKNKGENTASLQGGFISCGMAQNCHLVFNHDAFLLPTKLLQQSWCLEVFRVSKYVFHACPGYPEAKVI